MHTLPTDEQYLDELYERFKDDEWIKAHEPITTVDSLVEGARLIIKEGLLQPHELQRAVEALREASDPTLLFRGEFIGLLRRVALLMLEPYRRQIEGIPVGCLPTRILNAAAIQTPRGGAVIVLDQGVILHLGLLVRSYFAYYTWNAPDRWAAGEPYCRDHSRDDFGRTIQHLAAHCATGDLEYLRRITTLKCPSLKTYDQLVETFGMGIEIFIMLHEFGHVVLNHLSTSAPVSLIAEPAGEVTLYTNSELQEFATDEFAFRHYSQALRRPADVAFCCGLLFHFFHLAELIAPPKVRTHPPPLARWERIKSLASPSTRPESWANYLDEAFAPLQVGIG
jgi:hypothetical protein